MNISSFFTKIYKGISKVFSFLTKKENIDKAEETIKKLNDLADFALPALEMVNRAIGGNEKIDEVLKAASRMNVTIDEILAEPNDYKKAGILMNLASEVVRERLLTIVTDGKEGVKFGDKILRTVDEVLSIGLSILNGVVQPVYTLYKNSK